MRDTLIEVKNYLESKSELTKEEEILLFKVDAGMPWFPSVYISRDDLYTVVKEDVEISDEELKEMADKLQEAYTDGFFWQDLKIIADEVLSDKIALSYEQKTL